MTAIFDEGAPPSCIAPFNLAAYVLGRAEELGDKIALAVIRPGGAERWSYARLEAAVRGTATGLLAAGLEPGDRVLLRLGNTVDFPVAYLGAITAGLIPVPTSAQLTVPEVTKIVEMISPRLVIAGDGIALPQGDVPVLTQQALEKMRDLPPAPYAMGDPDRPAYMLFTSGTSGIPRAVVHAHRAIWARRMMWDDWYGLTDTDRVLHAGAFNWSYTLGTGLMDPWTVGATALIPEARVTPDQLPLLLKRYDATIFAAAPGVYRQMLRTQVPPLPKLRHGLSAGEKLPETTRAAWHEATGTPVYEAYGMTECSTFVSGAPTREPPEGASGFPQRGRRVAILTEDDVAGFGEPGILGVSRRDPGLMLGYFGAEAETEAKFRGEWFLTGDMFLMAEDGALSYLGRADDMMNAGGFRVSPIEVEGALNTHPEIIEAAAVEIAVKSDASVIAAFYVAERDLDEAELAQFAADLLARYKCPRLFRRVEALPKGANGKILRRALRERYEETHGQA
ncbi:MAG: acyl--CoA ligase [Rhodobacteraceae bacterium]|nr:acyl--CoA ligase [Paracoccaceae bacterium]